MAFGIYHLSDDGRPDWRQCAGYLAQPFYELVHELMDGDSLGPILTRIMTMGYDGNCLVHRGRHEQLLRELYDLQERHGPIAQLAELIEIVRGAHRAARALVISGDMYPELDKALRHSLPIPRCSDCGEQPKSPFWDICSCGYTRIGG